MTFDRDYLQTLHDEQLATLGQIDTFLEDYDTLGDQILAAQTARDAAVAALSAAEDARDAAVTARATAVANLATAAAEIVDLQAQIATLNDTITALNAQIVSLNAQIANPTPTIGQVQAQRDAALAQLVTVEAQLAAAEAQADTLRTQIIAANDTIATLDATIATLTANRDALNGAIATLNADITAADDTIAARDAEIVVLEADLEEAESGSGGSGNRIRIGTNIPPSNADGGAYEVRRLYYNDTNHLTRSKLQSVIDANPETKCWAISDKLSNSWSRLAAGTPNAGDVTVLDTWKNDWRQLIQNNPGLEFSFVWQHEPNDNGTAVSFRAACIFVYEWIRTAPANAALDLGICLIAENYGSGSLVGGWCPWDTEQDGFTLDFYAVDPYNWYLTTHAPGNDRALQYNEAGFPKAGGMAAYNATHGNKRMHIWETNSKPDPANANHRADWLRDGMRWWATRAGADHFVLFGGGGPEGNGGGEQHWVLFPKGTHTINDKPGPVDADPVADPKGNAYIRAWDQVRRNR